MATNEEILLKLKAIDELTPVMLKALQSMEASSAKMTERLDQVSNAAQRTSQNTDGLNAKTVTFAATWSLLKDAGEMVWATFGKVSHHIGEAINEAIESEKAVNALNGALVANGMYNQKTAQAIQDHVQKVEELTGVSDELLRTMIASGIQMGLSAQKAMEMEEAARKLAAATGKDVNEAFSLLQGAMAGNSRGLAKVLPQVKELTEAQLKSGGAINIVNKALDAQYKLYEGSFEVSLKKAKNSLSNVYEEFGKIIIQNPMVIKAVDGFTKFMEKLIVGVQGVAKWIKDNQGEIEAWATAVGRVLTIGAIALGVWAAAAGIAAIATGGLAAVVAVLASPITLVAAAAVGLTIAFKEWPGLFDRIMGGFKFLVGMFIEGFGALTSIAAKAAGLFNKTLATSLRNLSSEMAAQGQKLQAMGVQQVEYAGTAMATAQVVEEASKKETVAINGALKAESDRVKVAKERSKFFAGVNIGTDAERKAMEEKTQLQDTELKRFEEWLENKKRLAVSKTEEQTAAMTKAQLSVVGTSGPEGKSLGAQVAIDEENKKQAEIARMRQAGLITENQANEASLASTQRKNAVELQMSQLHAQEKADALGNSEAGFEMRQKLEEERFQQDLQNRVMRAEQEKATEDEIKMLKENANMEHLAKMNNDKQAYYEREAQMQEAAGNMWASSLAKIQAQQVKHGAVLGAIRGVQQTEEFKGTMDMLSNVSNLRNSHSKKAFEAGKAAAIAEATVRTFMSATAAFSSMAAIPIVGPALGAVAAAAAVASGFANIQKISAQKFQGGQADEGMDAVPSSLAGKSFVLSQGERVVQPQANKDLTAFLAQQKTSTGGVAGGTTYQVTLHYNGMGGEADARKMAEILAVELRKMSERGTPIISEKGIIK